MGGFDNAHHFAHLFRRDVHGGAFTEHGIDVVVEVGGNFGGRRTGFFLPRQHVAAAVGAVFRGAFVDGERLEVGRIEVLEFAGRSIRTKRARAFAKGRGSRSRTFPT